MDYGRICGTSVNCCYNDNKIVYLKHFMYGEVNIELYERQ